MFEEVTSWENLLLAWRRASRGKRGQECVARFEYRLEDNLNTIRDELREQQYRPGAYTSFEIHEPKRRLISAAPFRDRVVHHALCNVTEPVFERRFVDESYANRVGKGTHRALDSCQRYARKFPYALQIDVRQFFASIDHELLLKALRKSLSDQRVLRLVEQILESGERVHDAAYRMVYFPGDPLWAALRPRGLPIGNLTSQLWCNVYLDDLDHFVKRDLGCKGYVRYVDDLVLFAESKPTLWKWKSAVEARLAALRLSAHPHAHPRPVAEGIPFLGFIVGPARKRLKRRKGVHFSRKLRTGLRDHQCGKQDARSVARSLDGWLNHVRFANTVGLRKSMCRLAPSEILSATFHAKPSWYRPVEVAHHE